MKFLFLTALSCMVALFAVGQQKKSNPSRHIILEEQVPQGYSNDSIELRTFPVEQITYSSGEMQTYKEIVRNGSVKWKIASTKPVSLRGGGPLINDKPFISFKLEIGDSVNIRYDENKPVFSGRGTSKFNLIHLLDKVDDSLKNTPLYKDLSLKHKRLKSLNDYLAWNEHLNTKLELMLNLINVYKPQISTFAYNVIKERTFYEIEETRLGRFRFLIGRFGLTNQDLCAIYDSTLNGPAALWLQNEAPLVSDPYYLWEFIILDAYRQKNQFFKSDGRDWEIFSNDRIDAYVASYNWTKKKYKGLIREEVLAFFFHYPRGVIHGFGFHPKIEAILADYYKQPKYPAYKSAVRKYELEEREQLTGKRDIDFVLTDTKGNNFSKTRLKGKVTVLDFWFTGCKGCVPMASALKRIEEKFQNDTNVVFLSVSTDESKEQWLKSVAEGKYTSGNAINLYTGGEGTKHEIIRNFGVDGYPTLLLFDADGKRVINYPPLDPRKDNGAKLTELLQKQLALVNDGPYVWREKGEKTAISISGKSILQTDIENLRVSTDNPHETFGVKLQKELKVQETHYSRPEKLLVLSDIEGNFDVFRDLLVQNKVMDSAYNWTFDDGHLVFAGDMFDRGKQVTECLWLIYSLEEKAKADGGYVHFILGNHEIMNLQGDHRYVQQKYKENAKLIGKSLKDFYSEDSELGKWLRTKNIAEQIGDLLFAHGGFGSKINELPISISEMNDLARPFYADNRDTYPDEKTNTVMSADHGPFWYRGYYYNIVKETMIDSILQKFNASHIITGHTILGDTISTFYNNKVINTDTPHAKGNSEALLIEGTKFYRVNDKGQRWLLFDDAVKPKESVRATSE